MSSSIQREVAKRVFAAEFNDSTHRYTDGDDDFAPTYLLLPTGDAANRVFVVGTLTEKDDIGDGSEYWRARVVDPTGTFLIYAGEYQQESANAIRAIDPPAYVAVVGKPNTYETDDGNVITSIRPESITEVNSETRDHWIVETAEATMDRIQREEPDMKKKVEEIYGDDLRRYSDVVIDAIESLES